MGKMSDLDIQMHDNIDDLNGEPTYLMGDILQMFFSEPATDADGSDMLIYTMSCGCPIKIQREIAEARRTGYDQLTQEILDWIRYDFARHMQTKHNYPFW